MDFGLTEEQTELAGLTRKILAERDAPWGDLAAAGVLAAGLPASLGGAGLGLLEQCSVLIELGRAASSVPYLASIVLGAGARGRVRDGGAAGAVGRRRRGRARWCSPRRWPRKTGTTRGCLRPGPNGRTGSGCCPG